MRRLERIETLQSADAPATELLAEVRQLLREGEAWLAAERGGTGERTGGATNGAGHARAAADAIASCRETLRARGGGGPEG